MPDQRPLAYPARWDDGRSGPIGAGGSRKGAEPRRPPAERGDAAVAASFYRKGNDHFATLLHALIGADNPAIMFEPAGQHPAGHPAGVQRPVGKRLI